ncbi:MAG: hypothetical protein QOI30_3684, partial [Mycobacterium sp.]|nr:hypothetical protein [Mycobacterium sp.]
MARKAFRGLLTKPQLKVVAVGTNQAHAALEFGGPTYRHLIQQRHAQQFHFGAIGLNLDAGVVADR